MLRSRDRALLIAVYAMMAWKFLTFASLAAAGALAFALRSEIAGVLLLPAAGILAFFGVETLRSLRRVMHAPYM